MKNKMMTRITVILLALFMGPHIAFAQQDEECMNNLSLFDSYVKSKKYDDAYGPWMMVRDSCPKFNRAIYVHGEKILKHKIKNASGAEQITFINDLMLLHDQSREHFASKYDLGEVIEDKANLAYKYRKVLNKSNQDLYNMFDEAYTKDVKHFTNSKALYTYFSLAVDLFDEGKLPAQQMFDKYDDVNELIEKIISELTIKLNKLSKKEESGKALTKREGKLRDSWQKKIANFEEKIIPSMDKTLGDRANCDVLVPLYQKNFEEKKNDEVWLQRAMNRMFAKNCKEDPLFLKLVEQKYSLKPTADTAKYLYLLTDDQKYLDESLKLETDPLKKAKLYKTLAQDLKSKGSYGRARKYYMEAVKLNPSDGAPYLAIATMYAKSANNCGTDNFNKRAVFWLAANTAEKAGRVDGRLRSAAAKSAKSYRASAPSKTDIFKNPDRKVVEVGCWINRKITVPSID